MSDKNQLSGGDENIRRDMNFTLRMSVHEWQLLADIARARGVGNKSDTLRLLMREAAKKEGLL